MQHSTWAWAFHPFVQCFSGSNEISLWIVVFQSDPDCTRHVFRIQCSIGLSAWSLPEPDRNCNKYPDVKSTYKQFSPLLIGSFTYTRREGKVHAWPLSVCDFCLWVTSGVYVCFTSGCIVPFSLLSTQTHKCSEVCKCNHFCIARNPYII